MDVNALSLITNRLPNYWTLTLQFSVSSVWLSCNVLNSNSFHINLIDMGCKADEVHWQELTLNSSGVNLEEGEGVSVLSITASHSGFIRCKASNHRGTEVKEELFVVTGNFQ